MSNGRSFRRHLDIFEQTEDQPVPGGCDLCNAYQTVEVIKPGMAMIHVHHDDWCPIIRAREAWGN